MNELFLKALQPVAENSPCGDSEDPAASVVSQIETTSDAIHEALRSAFGESVSSDSSHGFDMASSGSEAVDLVELIVECLGEKSKSLILATYLPHLMLICHGLPGFRLGLDIVREIAQRFPADLFPRDRERLVSYFKRGVYVGNDDKVTDNYKLFLYLPITEREELPYALLRNARLKGTGEDAEVRYASDAAGSSPQFYVKLIDDIEATADAARAANAALSELTGESLIEVVNFSFIEGVERMGSIVKSLATEHCAGYPPVVEEEVAEGEEAAPGATVAATGEIVTRHQAVEQLRKIADFFHRTERHSPVSYRLRDTVRWCQMDLPELMLELLNGDEGTMQEIDKRVGWRKPGNEPGAPEQAE